MALDLSLTRVGVAGTGADPKEIWVGSIVVRETAYARLRAIRTEILDHCSGAELVVVEGPSYGSGTGRRERGHHERAGLWWLVTYGLWARDVPFAVVPPAAVKRYATGRGQATKDAVLLAAARRYPRVPIESNDEADALILLAMGLDHLGRPLAEVPKSHRAAVASVAWPEAAESA
ncbi:hypothetical protein ACGFNU_01965 [Spirillospora sp. NPDC048911]|uniref:hypothetical protein n=1 Tax=Spirillospora sp. NPDC048911 TaxID=3364527 RepID=UPI003724705C